MSVDENVKAAWDKCDLLFRKIASDRKKAAAVASFLLEEDLVIYGLSRELKDAVGAFSLGKLPASRVFSASIRMSESTLYRDEESCAAFFAGCICWSDNPDWATSAFVLSYVFARAGLRKPCSTSKALEIASLNAPYFSSSFQRTAKIIQEYFSQK